MKKFLSLTFALLFISAGSIAQINITYNVNEGDVYSSKVNTSQNIEQNIMGQNQTMKVGQGFGLNSEVISVADDGSFTLKLTYTSIMVDQPMAGLSYDSEKSTDEPTGPAQAIASVVGTSFEMTMNNRGEILEVTGTETMLDSMASNMGLTEDAQAAQFKAQMGAQYNNATMKEQMGRSMIIFPDKQLNIGDTWSNDESITTPFPMNIQTTYELVEYDDDTITINASSDVFTEEGSEMNMGGATMSPELSGVQSGTIVLDRRTALVISADNEQLISGTMFMTAPQELDIPMEIMGTIKIEGEVN